jgi:hypothetical protein
MENRCFDPRKQPYRFMKITDTDFFKLIGVQYGDNGGLIIDIELGFGGDSRHFV